MGVWTDRELRRLGLPRRNPLSARNALRLLAALTLTHAVVLIVSPDLAMGLFGAGEPGEAALWLRQSGVLFAGMAIVFWSASRWHSSQMQRPVLWTGMLVTTALGLCGVLCILDGAVDARYWSIAGVELMIAVWTGWLLVGDRV